MPSLFVKVAFFIKNLLFWVFPPTKMSNAAKINPVIMNGKPQKESEPPADATVIKMEILTKEIEDEEEMKRVKKKEEFDSNVAALNYFAFLTLFLIIFSCDLAFWILIGK